MQALDAAVAMQRSAPRSRRRHAEMAAPRIVSSVAAVTGVAVSVRPGAAQAWLLPARTGG